MITGKEETEDAFLVELLIPFFLSLKKRILCNVSTKPDILYICFVLDLNRNQCFSLIWLAIFYL